MSDIKIFVSCHKNSTVPQNALLSKIQVGTALSKETIKSAMYDNTGENISEKNKAYCELTAQYWAWKNVQAEYYGFFHYRRYLTFLQDYPVQVGGTIRAKKVLPYYFCDSPTDGVEKFAITQEQMEATITKYDIVTVLREQSNSTAYEQYCQFHKKADLDRMLEILSHRRPEYAEVAKEYMASRSLYFLNMYVMRKELFFAYMEWLFPLLEEFEQQTDFSDYSEQEYRACAYLAERLFGIWFTYMKKDTNIKCCELPYVIFENTEQESIVQPIFKEDSINVVMASDDRFVPYLSVALQSILEHANDKRCYDIVILHTKISEELQKRVLILGEDKKNVSLRFVNIKGYVSYIPFKAHQHISVETFYRYFIMEIMPDYKKVLYLDSDIIVLRDVAELFQVDVSNHLLAAVKDMDVIGTYKNKTEMQVYLKEKLHLDEPLNYFQAGVLVMNLEKLRKAVDTKTLIEKTMERKWSFVDQDVLNQVCKGQVVFLNQKWNVLMDWKYSMHSRMENMRCVPRFLWQEYCEARKRPSIIHYAGAWKPWNTPNCDFAAEFWQVARRNPFYEWILYENTIGTNKKKSLYDNDTKRVFRLKPTKIEVVVDMKKVNRLLPAGSLRRRIVRALLKKNL